MRKSGLVLALFLIASTLTLTARASEENALIFTQALVSRLALAPEPCREKNEGAGDGSVFVCTHATSDFDTFRRAWDGLMEDANKLPFLPTALTDWQTQVGGRIRWYALGDKWIVATFDSANHQVVLSYAKDRPGVLSLTKAMVAPRRAPLDYEDGEVRLAARVGLKPEAQGVVVLTAAVHKDGTVGEVEMRGCLPRHRGLEQAATHAIHQWRYTPAMKDGAAVDITMTASFTYGPGGTFRLTEGADTREAGRGSVPSSDRGGAP